MGTNCSRLQRTSASGGRREFTPAPAPSMRSMPRRGCGGWARARDIQDLPSIGMGAGGAIGHVRRLASRSARRLHSLLDCRAGGRHRRHAFRRGRRAEAGGGGRRCPGPCAAGGNPPAAVPCSRIFTAPFLSPPGVLVGLHLPARTTPRGGTSCSPLISDKRLVIDSLGAICDRVGGDRDDRGSETGIVSRLAGFVIGAADSFRRGRRQRHLARYDGNDDEQ